MTAGNVAPEKRVNRKGLAGLRLVRLEIRIAEFERESECLSATLDAASHKCVEASLRDAKTAKDNGELQSAWNYVHLARRSWLGGIKDDDEVRARIAALRSEADENLKNWRKNAVVEVLSAESGGKAPGRARPRTISFG